MPAPTSNGPAAWTAGPEDILQERRSATLDELIRLIRRVSPTGQLPPSGLLFDLVIMGSSLAAILVPVVTVLGPL